MNFLYNSYKNIEKLNLLKFKSKPLQYRAW